MGFGRRPRSCRETATSGQSIAEFALILPALLLMTLGVVDGARLFAAHITLTNAAREGAVYAAQHSAAGQAEVKAHIAAETADLSQSNLTVSAPVRTVSSVTVTVSYPFDLITPLIGAIWGDPVILSASTTAPVLE